MIKKSLLLKKFLFATPPLNPNATFKAQSGAKSLPKATTKRWNQADLGYFDFYLNKTYKKSEIVLVEKNVYYKNLVLFVQCFERLITFRNAFFVKANIATFFRNSVLE